MPARRPYSSALSIALLITACSAEQARHPGEVYTSADGSSGADGSHMPDMTSSQTDSAHLTDVATDAAAGADAASNPDGSQREDGGEPAVSIGQTCTYPDLVPFDGSCDPIRNTGCSAPQVCVLVIDVVGAEAIASAACRDPDLYTVPADTMCDPGEARCEATSTCVRFYDMCLPLCFAETAEGCTADEFCRRPSPGWGALGFCDTTCNQ